MCVRSDTCDLREPRCGAVALGGAGGVGVGGVR